MNKSTNLLTLIAMLVAMICITSVSHAGNVTFAYSGRVRVQGTPFEGTGHFKLAIVSNNGNTTYWSNDGTSLGGAEPTASIPIDVVDGVFSINVGDTMLGMLPINRTVFNQPNRIKLRIWFSDGSLGFEHLLPDANLNNVDLLGQESGDDGFTIYVNGTTGDDENDGLSETTAKKTISAAVGIVPPRLKATVTVKIAAGVYQEEVLIYGISTRPGSSLVLLGDEEWEPIDGGFPSVRVTGASNLGAPTRDAESAIKITNSATVDLIGLHLDYAIYGVYTSQSTVRPYRCAFTQCNYGIFTTQSSIDLQDALAENNDLSGFHFSSQSFAQVWRSAARSNNVGLFAQNAAYVTLHESGDYSSNTGNGIHATQAARILFFNGYSGTINFNGGSGIWARVEAYIMNQHLNTYDSNVGGDIDLSVGGASY